MSVLFVEYPKCSTCKKAKKWLDEHGVDYIDRHIVEDNPRADELAEWQAKSGLPVRRFFNTSGMLYREQGVKARLDAGMSDEDAFALSMALLERGVFAPSAVYPAVPRGKARLRFCVISEHKPEQIVTALDTLQEVAAELGIKLPE